MAETFDPDALLMAIDAIEESGRLPMELVGQLRGLVRERAAGRVDDLESEVRRLNRTVTHQRQDLAMAERRNARPTTGHEHCEIGGPWRHVAIDEQRRGSPGVALCMQCNREPSLSIHALDGPPSPISRCRVAVVQLNAHRFADGREASPAVHVGRCEGCGTWYLA